jgi:hypothetical protein
VRARAIANGQANESTTISNDRDALGSPAAILSAPRLAVIVCADDDVLKTCSPGVAAKPRTTETVAPTRARRCTLPSDDVRRVPDRLPRLEQGIRPADIQPMLVITGRGQVATLN